MLAAVDPALLERVRFPLGEQTKAETRAEAAAAGLAAARRAESQEACFLGGDDYRAFLERQGLQRRRRDRGHGRRALGSHAGHWRFTPGQRRGVGVERGRPLYVLGPTRRRTPSRSARGRRWPCRRSRRVGRLYVPVTTADVKVRYRSGADRGVGHRDRRTGFRLELDEPAFGVARGQFAVLYDDDAVVGAGAIADVA